MANQKDDVLAALGKVPAPDGTPLPATHKLSDIVVADGKVFFSITVDAGAIKQWETVREQAETAIRAVPGVKSVMVALTAERTGAPSSSSPASGAGGAAARPQMPPAGGRPRQGPAPGGQGPAGIPGVG